MSSPRPSPFRNPSAASPKPSLLPSPFPRELDDVGSSTLPSRPSTAVNAPALSRNTIQIPSNFDGQAQPPYPEPSVAGPGQASGSTLLPPRTFVPFFSLVKDTDTGGYVHPSVYYIFQDDDPEVMTTAALDAIHSAEAHEVNVESEDIEYEDRYIIVDVDESGHTIQEATSLSTRWAVTSARLQPAPVFGGADTAGGDGQEEGGLMLVVEGNGAPALTSTEGQVGSGNTGGQVSRRRPEHLFEAAREKSGEQSITTVMTDVYAAMEAQLSLLEHTILGAQS